jgi:hypothetical protein
MGAGAVSEPKRSGFPSGVDHPNAKLTPKKVRKIRELHQTGLSYRTLGAIFDVSAMTIKDIIKWSTWKS